MNINPDRACPHDDFATDTTVNRLAKSDGDPTIVGYSADLRIECIGCGEKFRFIGVQVGLSPHRPMCSVDETDLRIPIRPASSDRDFGMGIPGFAVTWKKA